MLQRSTWSGLVLSAAVYGIGALGFTSPVLAQDAPAGATPPPAPATPAPAAAQGNAATPAGAKLPTLADDFMHYALVNNTELAKANGEALLNASASPEELLQAFESTANGRVPRDIMLQAQRRPELKDVATRLLDRLEEGYRTVARDPQRVRAEVDRLNNGPRAYQNARDRLAAAGQFAVPIYIEYLQNGGKRELHPQILRVMSEIGRPLLLPIIEELRVSDPGLKIQLVNVIAEIGYPQALPALRAIQADQATSGELRAAVDNAIRRINPQVQNISPSDLNLMAAENYYNKKPSYQPLLPDEKTNPIWVFDPGLNNVQAINVPTPIWNSVMALRLAESTLKADANNGNAISLWLAANLRREIQLPQGATDPTRGTGPDAAFYARAAGPIYVNPVLARALDANDPALALRAIDALEATGGTQGLVSGGEGAPLVRALSHSDRSVRYRAAFALARANPASQFPSFFRVVPILAEAVNATGNPVAIVAIPDENVRNKVAATLREGGSHYTVYAGGNIGEAISNASRASAVDVIFVQNGPDVGRVTNLAHNDPRLANTPVLVAAPAADVNNLTMQLAGNKGVAAVDIAADDAAIATALQTARADTGAVAIDPERAAQYATTAIDLLSTLAADHHSIFQVTEAVPTLAESLRDRRPEIASGAARVLGKVNSQDGQRALAQAALSTEGDAALRVVYMESLAESAKRTGNALDAPAINSLIKVVSANDTDAKLKTAAATALGALNVPSNQASALILQQAK
jgi:hypothetical protein